MQHRLLIGSLVLSLSGLPISVLAVDHAPDINAEPKAVASNMPAYPPLARGACVQGIVAVLVRIAPDGSVVSADALYGHRLLRDAAVAAARQWRFDASGSPDGERREVIRFLFRVVPWTTPRRQVKAVFRTATDVEVRSYPAELTCDDCSPARARALKRSGRCPSMTWPKAIGT